jgi:hypothetical protein
MAVDRDAADFSATLIYMNVATVRRKECGRRRSKATHATARGSAGIENAVAHARASRSPHHQTWGFSLMVAASDI